jgi:hypothetical protein
LKIKGVDEPSLWPGLGYTWLEQGASMSIEKRALSDANVIYDLERRELYVETRVKGKTARISIDDALKMDGPVANELHLVIGDLFK